MNHIMRIIYAIKPSALCLVRTQCDLHSKLDCRAIELEVAIDEQYALKTLSVKVSVPATSTEKPLEFLENLKFNKLLTGKV